MSELPKGNTTEGETLEFIEYSEAEINTAFEVFNSITWDEANMFINQLDLFLLNAKVAEKDLPSDIKGKPDDYHSFTIQIQHCGEFQFLIKTKSGVAEAISFTTEDGNPHTIAQLINIYRNFTHADYQLAVKAIDFVVKFSEKLITNRESLKKLDDVKN